MISCSLVQSATLVVTNLNDEGPGSLRRAITTAAARDRISFAVSGTITLTNGELLIPKDLRIAGPGATNLAVSARSQGRVLQILPHAKVGLFGLTICDGRAPDGAAGSSNSPAGSNGSDAGGIYNAGFLTIAQCVISNCAAGNGGAGYNTRYFSTPDATNWTGGVGGRGGGIYNAGKLLLVRSRLTSNSSGAGGNPGGAGRYGTGGSPGGGGGAICNAGRMMLIDCGLENNAAGNGSAAYSLISWVFDGGQSGGAGGDGGAIYDASQATTVMYDCQFSFNASGAGGMGSTPTSPFSQPSLGGSGGAGGAGGALWAEGSGRMSGCTFLSNQTGPGAPGGTGDRTGGVGGAGGPGGAICAVGELSLTRCLLASNHAAAGGDGGIGYHGPGYSSGLCGAGGSGGLGGAVYAESALRLNDCMFSSNQAGSGGQGGSGPVLWWSYSPTPGGGGWGGDGGALYCLSDLAATNCTFNGNQAGNAGRPGSGGFNGSFNGQPSSSGSNGGEAGGISGGGALVLHACTLSGNLGGNGSSAEPGSGALVGANMGSALPTSEDPLDTNPHPNIIIYTTYGRPGGTGGTGGIHSEKSLKTVLCTLSGNMGGAAGFGGDSSGGYMEYLAGGPGGSGGSGAVCCSPSNEIVLVACTIAGNSGGSAGAGGRGVTVPDNSGRTGQGSGGAGGVGGLILNMNTALSASVINTLVASNFGGIGGAGGPYRTSSRNPGAPDLQGSFISLGHNLIGRTDGSSGFTNGVNGDLAGSESAPIDPLLGPITDNGGPTPTMALLHGSPALDAGDDAVLHPPYRLRNDQRGFPRKSGAHVDIGAFEFQFQRWGADPSVHALTLSATLAPNGNLQSNTASGVPAAAPNFQLTFSDNLRGATFTVLATTNLSLPFTNWSVLGQPVQIGPGLFEFTDLQATNYPQRFYRVSSP